MFKTFYEFYHYLLSQFPPLNNNDIKKLLDEALYWNNCKNNSKFMHQLRVINQFLLDNGKPTEANIANNYIQFLIYRQSNNK